MFQYIIAKQAKLTIEHVDVRHRVEDRDPPHQQLAHIGLGALDVLLQQRYERFDVKSVRLCDNVFD